MRSSIPPELDADVQIAAAGNLSPVTRQPRARDDQQTARAFEQADRTVIVACGERPDAATEIDCAAARRQLAVGCARFQLG